MVEENVVFGKRIRAVREKQNLSRERLAELANISTQFLADIETGKKGMSVVTLKKICVALQISSDFIIFERNNGSDFSLDAMLVSLTNDKQEDLEKIMQMIIKLCD